MAKRKEAITVRRHVPVVPKKKYELLVKSKQMAAKRAREVASERMGALVGIGACAAVGLAEKHDKIPEVAGFGPAAVVGAAGVALAFLVPSFVKGKGGQMAAEAGAALTGLAAYRLAKGEPLRVGEDNWSAR